MSTLDKPGGWSIRGYGSMGTALRIALARLEEASNRMANMDGQRSLQSAIDIVRRIETWAKEHEVLQPLYVPPSNKSDWE